MNSGVPITLAAPFVTRPRSPIFTLFPCALMKMLSHLRSRWMSAGFFSGPAGTSSWRYRMHSRISRQ